MTSNFMFKNGNYNNCAIPELLNMIFLSIKKIIKIKHNELVFLIKN